jgi:20S proteasome subunit beta 7
MTRVRHSAPHQCPKSQVVLTDARPTVCSVSYAKRNKFNPLWNHVLVAGFQDGAPFLGHVDLIGTAFQDNVLATGFGTVVVNTRRIDSLHP